MFYSLKQHLSTWWQRFFLAKRVKLVLGYELEQDNNIFHIEMAQFHLPPNLDLTDGNFAESFRKCKRQLEVYMEARVELITSRNSDKQRSFYNVLARKFSKSMIISTSKPRMTKTIQRRSSKSLKRTVTREKTKFSKVFDSGTNHSTSLLMCS